MRRNTLVLIAATALLSAGAFSLSNSPTVKAAPAAGVSPVTFDKQGDLRVPANYREWVYLTSGIDMSYTESTATNHSTFDNVFVNSEAYRSFVKTGIWPDKTAFVLEVRAAKSRGSINLRGHYQDTQVMGIEVHVKDESRFPGKWGFYEVDSSTMQGKLFPQDATCDSCHTAHGAVDTTFVQFYPTLLPIAQQKHTLSKEFQDELSAPAANQ